MTLQIPNNLVPIPTQPWAVRPDDIPIELQEARTALWLGRGNITSAAAILKVPAARLRRLVRSSNMLSMEMEEARQQLVDLAEENVLDALTDGNDPGRRDSMTRFVLASQGKERGWGTGQGGGKISVDARGGNVVIQWADGSSIQGPSEDSSTPATYIDAEVIEAAND